MKVASKGLIVRQNLHVANNTPTVVPYMSSSCYRDAYCSLTRFNLSCSSVTNRKNEPRKIPDVVHFSPSNGPTETRQLHEFVVPVAGLWKGRREARVTYGRIGGLLLNVSLFTSIRILNCFS